MKLLKKIFGIIATILVFGGLIALMWLYFKNKALLNVLLSNSIVKGSIVVLTNMAYCVGAMFAGLICFMISMKFASIDRRNEREKKQALKEQAKESKELNRQLKKEAEEARAEAEQIKKENEKMKQTIQKQEEAAEAEKVEEKA